MEMPKNAEIPCFLCGKLVRVKLTKNDKPYFICEPCGLQVFVRCKSGIQILKRLLSCLAEDSDRFLSINSSSYRTLSLVSRLDELKRRLDQVQQNKSLSDYFLSGSESELAENALEREIGRIRGILATDQSRAK